MDIPYLVSVANNAHRAIQFTHEKENANHIPFLDVSLRRQNDGKLSRSVYRKASWTGQYVNFSSFVPMVQKRNLVKNLVFRAKNICTEDTLKDELQNIRNILRDNGFPDKFIEKHMVAQPRKPKTSGVPKKTLFLNLAFKGDLASEVLINRLQKAVEKTFNAAYLLLTFQTRPALKPTVKEQLPSPTSSMCIYTFDCSCGASYVGRTTRQLSKRIREHIPTWFGKGQQKSINSSILAHLVDTNHQVDTQKAFKVIYRIPSKLPRGLRVRLLHTAEAVCIRLLKPDLCIQKKYVQALALPWPEKT